jgi:peptidoglycan/xylan/chitin deacetylase (PgdA/CDA1 family)
MFHRLHAGPRQQFMHNLCFSEAGLIALLEHCLRSGIDVVDINEALRRLQTNDGRYFVVLTFDDGYRDNYSRLLPIMTRFGLPFTVFVCSSMIDRTLDYWWGGLFDLFSRHDKVEIEPMAMRFTLQNSRDKQAALGKVTQWVEGNVALRSAELAPTFRRYGVVPADLLDRDAMTEAELRSLSENPFAAIGGHGVTHRPLAALSEAEAMHEIIDNQTYLERVTGRKVEHFAYPFGDNSACTWREAELVRSAGYVSAFTTRIGNLFPQHSALPFMLPRGSMNPEREKVYHAEAQFAGVHWFLKSRGGPPINPETLPPILAHA